MFDINIDTIVLHFDVSNKNVDLKGWRQNKKNKKLYTKKTDVAYYMCNSQFFYLNVQLSLSKLQNGNNAKRFNHLGVCDLLNKINQDLKKTTKNEFFKVDWGNLCRIDLNKDFVFNKEKDADEFNRFLYSLPSPRQKMKKEYDTGFSVKSKRKNKTELRVYRKDLDPHLEVDVRNEMNPTTRMEFEYNQIKNIRSFFGTANLTEILLNPQLTFNAWYKMLEKYKLSAVLLNKKQFFSAAKKVLGVKDKTFKKYKKIIKKGWANKELTADEKRIFLESANQLFKFDIIPGYCDVDVSFISTLSKKFLKKFTKKVYEYFNKIKNRNKQRNKNKSFINYCYVRFNWLDSS